MIGVSFVAFVLLLVLPVLCLFETRLVMFEICFGLDCTASILVMSGASFVACVLLLGFPALGLTETILVMFGSPFLTWAA
jgi:hypothetical protein